MGTMEGFLLGQALAPDYDTGPAWKARAMREKERADYERETAQEWKAEAERLESALNKEHKRFLIERRERRNYMRWWAVRGQILRDMVEAGKYTNEEWDAAADRIDHERDQEYLKMRDEADHRIDQEAASQS